MTTKDRNVNIDLIRLFAMLCVIYLHVLPNPLDVYPVFRSVVLHILSVSIQLFFMVSGYFNLSKTFNSKEDYRKFYLGRLISIFFPFLVVAIAIYIGQAVSGPDPITFRNAWAWLNSSLSTETHMWFVFILMGMIFSTPVLSKALHAMEDYELNIIVIVGFIWVLFAENLTTNLGFEFHYGGWIFSGYVLCYFFGYYCKRMINSSNRKHVYISGIISFGILILNCYTEINIGNSVFELLFGAAIFEFFLNGITIKNETVCKFIRLCGKYSYFIYLFHWNIITKITPHLTFINSSNIFLSHFEKTVVTFVASLIISIIADKLFFQPVEKLLRKLCKI